MHLIPRMATALVFFIYIGEEGLNAQLLTRRYQTPKQLCGAALSNELQLVCEGEYNSMIKKSEDNEAQLQEWRRIDIDEDNYAIFPFRSRRSALAFNTSNFFRRRIRIRAGVCNIFKGPVQARTSVACAELSHNE
ncbi:UNVERIFIED_CONTAM: hypothetical protein PYX00_005881 [Menopon gallinae]|uniref:Uncharacterized protein n=1 Tax=Menopon gallinae TaxID=328185 RepID=A0AAW2HTC2_9NEOP